MKKYVVDYLARCLEYEEIKVEHQHPTILLDPLPILEWKWEVVSIDFIIGLSRTKYQHDSIMVVVDTLTKTTHFLLVQSTFGTAQMANIFMR